MGTATFPSGTRTIFQHTNAPTGWTKITSYNNYALRTVTGATSTGGTVAFTSVHGPRTFTGTVNYPSGTSTGSTTATVADHPHSGTVWGGGPIGPAASPVAWFRNIAPFPYTVWNVAVTSYVTSTSPGGASAHSHPFSVSGSLSGSTADWSVKYVDCIIAQID